MLKPYKATLLTLISCVCAFLIYLLATQSSRLTSSSSILMKMNRLIHEGRPPNLSYEGANIKLACWVMTHEGNEEKVRAINETWGKRCEFLFFVSTKKLDIDVDWVIANYTESRASLWAKTYVGFMAIYDKYYDKADWFMRVDDDGYVIIENLKNFLSTHNKTEPIFFGCEYKTLVKQGYVAGGPGTVLSKEALRRMVEDGMKNKTVCPLIKNLDIDDVEIGRCLEKVGVKLGDSRDDKGKMRFFPFPPETHLQPEKVRDPNFWYWQYIRYPEERGLHCCSDTVIGFHYMDPGRMRSMEYFVYQVHLPYK